jgi:LPXTG-motif cell wall-anchored protein
MKLMLTILGVLLILVGGVWLLQGLNVLLGSVMSGQSQWTVIGAALLVVGIGLLVFANRRKNTPRM